MNSDILAMVNQLVRQSIREIAEALECSFEIESLSGDQKLYKEICRIIADVFIIHPDCMMRVASAPRSARNVQEMYSLLTGAHIEMVAEKFAACDYEIKNRVMWMRTALYNAPMEFDSYYTNQVNTDWGTT